MSLNTVIIELPYAGAVFTKLGAEGFFWCDSFNVEAYGPFTTVYNAMKHYTALLKNRGISPTYTGLHVAGKLAMPAGDLISVDFKNKKRIS